MSAAGVVVVDAYAFSLENPISISICMSDMVALLKQTIRTSTELLKLRPQGAVLPLQCRVMCNFPVNQTPLRFDIC